MPSISRMRLMFLPWWGFLGLRPGEVFVSFVQAERPAWLANRNFSAEPVMIVLRVIVIVTRAGGRQRIGCAALPGL